MRVRATNAWLAMVVTALVAGSCGGSSGGCPVPEAATNLHLESINGSTVVLAWAAPPSATSYLIEAGSAPGQSDQLRTDLNTAATTYTANGVKPGTYYTRVFAVNGCGTGPASNELTVVAP
jgi:hypothetical protein